MQSYIEKLKLVQEHMGMVILSPSRYYEVVTFVLGFDMATDGNLLDGFSDWLLVRYNEPDSSIFWPWVMQSHMFPDSKVSPWDLLAEQQEQLTTELWACLNEFLVEKEQQNNQEDPVKTESINSLRT